MKIQVVVKSGKELKNVERITGTSDPYVRVLLDDKEQFQTAVQEDTLEPVWDHSQELEWDEKSILKFEVWDKNQLTMDKAIGEARITIDKERGFSGPLSLSTGGSLEVSVQPPPSNEVGMLKKSMSVSWEDITENDVLMWRKRSKAGLILGAVDLVFFVHFFYAIEFLTLVSNVGLSAIFLGFILKFAGCPVALTQYELFPESSIPKISRSVAGLLIDASSVIQDIIFVERLRDGVKGVVALYILKCISTWMSVSFFAFLVFNTLFIVPIQLKRNQGFMKKTVEPKLLQVKKIAHDFLEKVPKHTDISKDD